MNAESTGAPAAAPAPAAPPVLTSALKETIQTAYRAWLAARSFKPRRGQREMIGFIARTLTDPEQRIGLIEAGTGTGKTAGYVLPAIPIAQALGKQVVIGTATVALQEQVVLRDLPDLVAQSGLNFSFEIAKGRGRYLCVKRLDDHLRAGGGQAQLALEGEGTGQGDYKVLYQQMLERFMTRRWDGEQDSWDGELEADAWRGVTTDHRGCSNKRCSFFKQCPFFRARATLEGAAVVVANHDLILADLALGGGAVLSPPEDTVYLIDEAHHLPAKTQQHFSQAARLGGARAWADQLTAGVGTMAQRLGRPQPLVDRILELTSAAADLAGGLFLVEEACDSLPFEERDEARAIYRFPLGVVDAAIVDAVGDCRTPIQQIIAALERVRALLQQVAEGELDWAEPAEAEDWLPVLGQLEGRALGIGGLIEDYARAGKDQSAQVRIARWAVRSETDVELVTAPIDPGRILTEQFWDPAHAVIMTSATLTSMGRFERFTEQIGLPQAASLRIPSPFDYPNISELVIPALVHEPSDATAHTDEVGERLPALLEHARSALVLCTSWRQLRRLEELLPETLRTRTLVQGDSAKHVLLTTHRERIDAGEASYLMGVASFAEGLDLPDDYCRHVIIPKLPFAVPDDPLSEATAEWLESEGRNAFFELQVPDAAMRLVQACGRLIRHEGDYGRISLLDRRVVTKRYGRALLESLPPYRLVVE